MKDSNSRFEIDDELMSSGNVEVRHRCSIRDTYILDFWGRDESIIVVKHLIKVFDLKLDEIKQGGKND